MNVTFKKSDFHGVVSYSETWLSNGCVAFRKGCVAPKMRPYCATKETLAAFFGRQVDEKPEVAFDTLCAKPPYALTLKRTGLLWEKTGGLARLYMTASGPARGAWVNDRYLEVLGNPYELVGHDERSPLAVVEDNQVQAVVMPCRSDYPMAQDIMRAAYMMGCPNNVAVA